MSASRLQQYFYKSSPHHTNVETDIIDADKIVYGKIIGEGEYGIVREATYQGINIAVKTSKNLPKPKPKLWQNELAVTSELATVNSSYIVKFFNCKINAVVMAHAPNGALERRIDSLSLKDRYQIMSYVINGIAVLHRRDILHCDIKPLNILLGYLNDIYLGDFGFSCKKAPGQTAINESRGTPVYAAPEQKKKPILSEKTDIYQLGVTLLEISSGSLLSGGPKKINKNVFFIFKNLITRCLEHDPDLRPTAEECLAEINKIINDHEIKLLFALHLNDNGFLEEALASKDAIEKVFYQTSQYTNILADTFFFAAKAGILIAVQTFLEHTPNLLEQKDAAHQTALLWAAAKGHDHVVAYLLEKGANPNVRTILYHHEDHGKTPLIWAAQNKYLRVIEVLLTQKKLKVTAALSTSLIQAIHVAAQHGDLSTVKLLIEQRPNLLEQKDCNHQTPLLWAAANGFDGIVSFLLEKGANPNVYTNCADRNHDGKTPLIWAVQNRRHRVIEVLLTQKNLQITATFGSRHFQAIHIAAECGDLFALRLLHEHTPSLLDEKDTSDRTPLYWAEKNKHTEVIDYINDQQKNKSPINISTHPAILFSPPIQNQMQNTPVTSYKQKTWVSI